MNTNLPQGPDRPEVSQQKDTKVEVTKDVAALGSILGAIGASACCVLPFVLFTLGVSGAWMGNLTALEPYQPYFVALTLVFLGMGFYMVYRKPKPVHCDPEGHCARPISERIVKTALWVATALVALALAWPYIIPLLLG
jgi:mercuric ion transport protein